jgi:hypothetical protein
LQYIKNCIKDINHQLDTERHTHLLEWNHLNYLRRLEKKKKHHIIMENSSEDITVRRLVTCFVPSSVIVIFLMHLASYGQSRRTQCNVVPDQACWCILLTLTQSNVFPYLFHNNRVTLSRPSCRIKLCFLRSLP